MSTAENLDIETRTRLASIPGADLATRSPPYQRDPWLRIGAQVFLRFPLPGQPGHGRTAFLRRRPVRIVDGRIEGGYTSAYELICPSCGDHPYLDFVEVPPQLQWLRGPYVLEAGVAAYEEHLGLPPGRRRPAPEAQVPAMRRKARRGPMPTGER